MSWNTINRGCFIALSLFSIVENIEIDVKAAITQRTDTAEPILADVMKNITRVNTMLQELIKNYEKLEKISKAHSDENDSTDTEVEALFDDERKKMNGTKSKATTDSPTHKAYATAMFLDEPDPAPDTQSESHDTKSSSDSEEVKEEGKLEKEVIPKKKEEPRMKKDKPPTKKEKQEKKKHVNIIKTKNEGKKEKRKVIKPTEVKRNGSEVENKSENSFAPAINALKDLFNNLSDEPASKDSTEAEDKNDTMILTISSTNKPVKPGIFKLSLEEQNSFKEKKHLEPRLEPYETPEIFRRVRKSNDGDTILIGTPVKKNQTEEKDKKSNTTKIIESINNKIKSSWSVSEAESSAESKTILNEELKTNVLRQAYGDACLKLVVRKCTMACKSVLKDVCNKRRHCPNMIRDEFKKWAVSGCRDAFHNHSHPKNIDWRTYSGKIEEDGSNDFDDMTRIGDLSITCFPYKRMQSNEKQGNSTKNLTLNPAVKTMNILRDRYEAACQEESMKKCYKACTNAAKHACKGDKCSKRRMKEFGAACKTRCKQKFGVTNRKSKESDSDSHSDSSDGDSDDSDGDGKKKDHHHDGDQSWE